MPVRLVSETHIDAILTAGLSFGPPLRWLSPTAYDPTKARVNQLGDQRSLDRETAGRVGAMLLAENQRSVNHVYNVDEWEPAYVYRRLPGSPDPLIALTAVESYVKQAREHAEWPDSEAYQCIDALRCRFIMFLPGYEIFSGGRFEDREIFTTR